MSVLTFTADPFENELRLQRAISQSLDRPLQGLDWTPSGQDLYPSLNVCEEQSGNAIVVMAEVPGIDRASLQIESAGNRLMISGHRDIPSPTGEFRYHRRERKGGEFRRVFRLPFEVDRDKATATFRDGVLTIRLEKTEAAKARQIAVKD